MQALILGGLARAADGEHGHSADEARNAAAMLAALLDGLLLYHLVDPRVEAGSIAEFARQRWPRRKRPKTR